MKRQRGIHTSRMFAAALAVSLMTGSIAVQARDNDRDHERKSRYEERRGHDRHARQDNEGHDRRARNHDKRDRYVSSNHHQARQWRREHVSEHRWDDRRDRSRAYAHGYQQGRFDAGRYYRPYGYRHYAWHRGARLPAAYYAPRYIVHDYADYRLYHPPHGHHWVRVDHDVVLTAIATGAVIAVVSNLFY